MNDTLKPAQKRIDDIELLRAVAVVAVVMHHANGNLLTVLSPFATRFYAYFGGWFGVDLFFAISGFVIARRLLPQLIQGMERQQVAVTVIEFWLRRIWRLWPSAWLWLAIILVASICFNDSGVFGFPRTNIEATVAGVLQVANVRFEETFGVRDYGASFPYWSLSLEEQFYLLLPLIALATRKYLLAVLLVLIVGQLFVTRSLFMMAFRTDALALGVLIALWETRNSYRLVVPSIMANRWVRAAVLFGLLSALSMLGSDVLHIVSMRVGLIAVLSAILVWIASYDKNYLCADKGPVRRIVLWVGSRSYALYLTHVPAFFFTRELFHRFDRGAPMVDGNHNVLIVGVAVGLMVVFSELNFRLVENPLRAYGGQVARLIRNAAI